MVLAVYKFIYTLIYTKENIRINILTHKCRNQQRYYNSTMIDGRK